MRHIQLFLPGMEPEPTRSGYPWPALNVGDSVTYTSDDRFKLEAAQGTVYYYARVSGRKYRTRIEGHELTVTRTR